jgi:hypothetical protein
MEYIKVSTTWHTKQEKKDAMQALRANPITAKMLEE